MDIFDCIVVGGGPAGLTAAIYLGRFKRSVLVIDSGHGGRWDSHEINQNYMGFPDGISTQELRAKGKQQAERFHAKFAEEKVVGIEKHENFEVQTETKKFFAKTLIIASGVKDKFPRFESLKDCLGKSLFVCITCDGYKTQNKRITVIGNSNDALVTAVQFMNYSKDVSVVTDKEPGSWQLNPELIERLKKRNIAFYDGIIEDIVSEGGLIKTIKLHDGRTVETDFVFSMEGALPNSDLARSIGVDTDSNGYILTNNEQRTNIKGVYAAGDVTREFAHQVVTAAHEGATAAQAANYDLYDIDQK